jgi:glycosyltransferase involved in cell wall biosynthesis
MKILHVNKYYSPWIGGIERIVEDLSNNLQASHKVTTLVCNTAGKPTTIDQVGNVEVERAHTWFTLLRLPISTTFFSLFKKHAANADLFLIHHPFPLGFLAYLLFGEKKPLVVFYHSDVVKQTFTAALLAPLFKSTLKHASQIIVTSNELKQNSSLLTDFQDKTTVIPLWINNETLIKPISIESPLFTNHNPNLPLILAVGRLVSYKGYDVLLQAMRNVSNAQLLIIGEGRETNSLKELIEQHNLNDRVFVIPPVAHLAPFYHSADIFVLPSVTPAEAFGLTQLEAMTCGVPVINTSLPTAVPTVSLDKKTGLTVEPGNADELARALQTLIDNPSLRELYGNAGKERARTHFSKQQSMERINEVINLSDVNDR